MGRSLTTFAPKLTEDDIRLVADLKRERRRMRDQMKELKYRLSLITDTKIGRKFGVSAQTISRVEE